MSQIEHVDVLVVGAGLSGIGAAYRLQTEAPTRTYAILEARDSIGGTWDLFRYPGVRSDSDMMTLGFPFEPWTDPDAIADGPKILSYLEETARKYGIDERIRFGHKVVGASWSTPEARWTVTVERGDGVRAQLTCGFLQLCSGYYDYERPHDPELPGIGSFSGDVVHPQFWPDGLPVAGRRVVVIGSGATAVTLVPSLADLGAHVTMLQRTPTWVTALPRRDRVRDAVQRVLPTRAGGVVARYQNVLATMAFYELSRRRPGVAKSLLAKGAARSLGSTTMVSDHFTPTYDPWDQRLCVVPDGDLFDAVRSGRAHVVTDTIETFAPDGIRLGSGRHLPADLVVTATGLRIKVAGGIEFTVDGERRPTRELTVYRGTMFADVPNLAVTIGYVNASWTLRADLASRYVCRLLNHMEQNGWRVAVPRAPEGMEGRPLLPLRSGYVERAAAELPQQGDGAPWLMRQNYLLDRRDMLRGDVTEAMSFVR
ncbi:flavin-containing monooxygenase [Terrabacter terrigena]|uniref:Flavin-containing monooxygenase n=1 Tax=Terrabacter terrigena TaxID=574718 RepID=A0ABW3N4A9_9MICO